MRIADGRSKLVHGAAMLLLFVGTAHAEWKAANPQVQAAAKDPSIASVLKAVNAIDLALLQDDHGAFTALLAKDLVVNNPQNGISMAGATGRRNTAGLISYKSYIRSIEYAGMLGEMVLLMGDEVVIPKGDSTTITTGNSVRRRFTDIWKMDGDRWILAARQATIVAP